MGNLMADANVNPRETGDWSVETLFAHITALVGEVDRRYEQRFTAQELAVKDALNAAEKAIVAAFAAQEKAIQAAFEAQEKAITKAETANEKRFEGVNEFRDQLRDQATLFMPRSESEARTTQNSEKIDQLDRRLVESVGQINSRLDLMSGRDRGEVDTRKEGRDSSAAIIAFVGIGITVLLAMITIIGFILSQGSG